MQELQCEHAFTFMHHNIGSWNRQGACRNSANCRNIVSVIIECALQNNFVELQAHRLCKTRFIPVDNSYTSG
ncbi:hypothetical protein AGMMS49992_05930 [Clostridia bacterium]|nr:hypothetical protein AGMMS49992_05930 [Clostridia bacterium]